MTTYNSRSDRRRKLKEKKKPTWKKVMKILLIIIAVIIIFVVGLFTYYIATAPKLDEELLDVPFASQFLDQDGEVFGDLGSENRIKIQYDDLPDVLIDALIATEDARYFEHPGIDIRRIFGAVLGNLKNGFGSEGASTLTQQVVENMFLTPEKKIKLKVQEQWLAIQLERKYSKEEILEMYLNKVFFGSNAYGVGKAAEVYFGIEDLNELSLVQAAILAGLPQRPTAYNPFENPDLMQGRVNTVLKLMVRHGKISQAEADEALAVDIPSVLTEKKPTASPYRAFIQQIEKEIGKKIDGVNIESDGLIIHTTLDTNAQEHVEFLLTDSEDNPVSFPEGKLQAGMAVLDTKSGAIRAIGGSRNKESDDYNHAINLKRQGGSVVKPMLAYGPAIEYEKWSTYHQILDEEYTPEGSNPIRNVTRTYKGWVTARYALAQSINVPAAKTLVEIGSERSKEFAESLGLSFADKTLDPRDALGGTASVLTPLELAGAYSAFGNEGIYNEPYAVIKVEFPDGSVIDLKSESEVVMHDYTAYMVTDMMKSVIKTGTGKSADIPGMHLAGKTGTTDERTDSWFGGFSTNYTIGIWTGYPDVKDKLTTTEAQIARSLFKHTMTELSKDIDSPDFTKPDSVVEVAIEKNTNPAELASENTPSDRVVKELFVKDTEPTAVSETFEDLEAVTNLEAKYDENENTINVDWDYPEIEDAEIEFEVNFKVNDGDFKNLTTTTDKQVALLEVDDDVIYTIQVIAIDKENDRKSDPTTTSVQIKEIEEEEEDKDIPAVNNLAVVFNRENNSLDVSWSYDGPAATFEVVINGNQKQIVQTTGVTINGAQPGAKYEIVVTAISMENDDNRGKAASTSITVEEKEEEKEPEENPDESDNNDNNNDNNNNDNNKEENEKPNE